MNDKKNAPVVKKSRSQLFNDMTNRKITTYSAQNLYENRKTIIELDPVDLTTEVLLLVELTVDVIHASAETYTPIHFAPYGLFNRIKFQLDNNFTPYDIQGITAGLINLTSNKPAVFTNNSSASARALNILTTVADTDGGGNENQTAKFLIPLPLTLNERDLNGAIMTQNKKTMAKITLDVGTFLAGVLGSASGYTTDTFLGTVTPIVVTYEIPKDISARPDWRQVKLVHEEQFSISSAGTKRLELDVKGLLRRVWMYFHDGTDGFTDAELTKFEILENGKANRPWEISSRALMTMNHRLYGQVLPQGSYCLDFASQGIANYGNHRDWFDVENLTKFDINVTTSNTGTAYITTESLVGLY